MKAPGLPFLAATAACLAIAPAAHAETRSLEQISVGPQAGPSQPYDAQYDASTADGSRVFFTTAEPLVAADGDAASDVYMRSGGTTTLISGGAADEQADFEAVSTDGSRVIFGTAEPLDADDDTDGSTDLYEWHDGTITLLTDGLSATDPDTGVNFSGITPDATHVYFWTSEPLTATHNESPAREDIYERSGGTTTQVSIGTATHETTEGVISFFGASPDGSRAYWGAAQQLTANDQDPHYEDIFVRSGGATTILTDTTAAGPDADDHVGFDAMSDDGSRIAFSTLDAMSPDDGDTSEDVYVTDGQSDPQLVSSGTPGHAASFAAANAALTRFAFTTPDQVVAEDDDLEDDVYVRDTSASTPTLVTPDTDEEVGFARASKDLSRVFFETFEPLGPGDADSASDVYEQHGATRSLVTTGPADPHDQDEFLDSVSDDGTRAFWVSYSAMTSDDSDGGLADVYERSGGTTRLLSPDTDNEAWIDEITPDGSNVFFTTAGDVFASRVDQAPPTTSGGGGGGGQVPQEQPRPLPGPPAPADVTAPLLKLAKPGKQRVLKQKGVIVTLSADENSTASLAGTAGGVRLKPAKRVLKAGAKTKVKLTLKKADFKKLAKALKRHRKLRAKVTIAVTDAAGNRSAKKLTIALKR